MSSETNPLLSAHAPTDGVPEQLGNGAACRTPAPVVGEWRSTPSRISQQRRIFIAFAPLVASFLFLAMAAFHEYARQERVPTPAPGDGLVFMVVGDWGREGRSGQRRVARAMAKVAQRVGPRFVLSSGDNFYETGVESVDDRQWDTSFERVYTDPALRDLAWWVILGNHDHLQSIAAQVHYSGRSRRWTLPAPYYTFNTMRDGDRTRVDVQFICLDSTPFVHDGYGKAARKIGKQHYQEQVAWLEETLANATAKYLIIVVHHNLYTMSTTGHLGTSELRAHVEPLLLRYGPRVLAVITGHEHSLMHMQPYGGPGAWAGVARHGAHGAQRGGSGDSGAQLQSWRWMTSSGTTLSAKGVGWSGSSLLSRGHRDRAMELGTVDHFISGGGSSLDDITPPTRDKAHVWASCCGVLSIDGSADEPRALWGESVHGFFVFTVTSRGFYADAYDDKAKLIYSYEKLLPSGGDDEGD